MTQKVPELDRMIHFTLSDRGLDFAIKAKDIRGFQRNPENPILIVVTTYVMTQTGPLGFEVRESFLDCVEMYSAALEGRPSRVSTSTIASN